ncbi:hypothetical protein [Fibrella forsythiae]|uniref:DUF805 domain-containing protein n=1 Tax=Fibrella forsythiae TaxID=2817061 RepID=A0ABS3JDY5_9BACT|nr:hypothetical protein [Fibrella forsythiae]MBO0948206.1 hypothetical protein [Fibrella forsythiae]
MHGTIIHYDPLTQCGLLRTEAGQVQYFRLDEVVSQGRVAAGQPVALRNGVLVDTGGSQQDASLPIRPPQRPTMQPASAPVATQVRSGRNIGWIGAVLAIGALILLMLSGGEQSGYASPNPRLLESIFGMTASILLVLEAVFFMSSAGSRRRIRWTFWLVVWSSLFAYVGQTFDGFEADDATGWYAYALLTLGFAVYILPYRSK